MSELSDLLKQNTANLELVFKSIAEIAARLDRLEMGNNVETFEIDGKLVAIDTSEPLIEQVRRQLVATTLDTTTDPNIRGLAVAKLDAYQRKGQTDHSRRKAELAKVMQDDWQAKTDAEMFARESVTPTLYPIVEEISKEVVFARSKFPGDNVTFAALVEEVGELATAIFSEDRASVRKEAVQVATMAIRIILDGDATFEPWRKKHGLNTLRD